MDTFIDRLREERNNLEDKITKLEAFIDSEEFENIDSMQRRLLTIQKESMRTYAAILNVRLAYLVKK